MRTAPGSFEISHFPFEPPLSATILKCTSFIAKTPYWSYTGPLRPGPEEPVLRFQRSGRALRSQARRRMGPGAIARPNLPQDPAATFWKHINAGFIRVFRFQNVALARNESRIAQVKRAKSVEFDRDLFRVGEGRGLGTRDLRRDRPENRQLKQRRVKFWIHQKGHLNMAKCHTCLQFTQDQR